jgi:hypothetical protein
LPHPSAERILAASFGGGLNVLRRTLALGLAVGLVCAPAALAQPAPADSELAMGIRLVEDGDYDSGIVTLDSLARRLAGDRTRIRDLSQAYLYLGIAYIGKGHEAAAKAKFREAVAQIKDLTLSPDKFPPKVIDLFEAARAEMRAQGPEAAPSPAPRVASTSATPAAKHGGGGKTLLVVGGLAVVGGGVALAAGGGGSGSASTASSNTPTTTLPSASMQMFNGMLVDQEAKSFVVTASKAGMLQATVTWQDRTIGLSLDCALSDPPYTDLGMSHRTTDTSVQLSVPVTGATSYLLQVANYSGRAGPEPFTLTVLYP